MRKKKSVYGVIVFAFAVVGAINTACYLLGNTSVCTGQFEGDPNAICYPLISK